MRSRDGQAFAAATGSAPKLHQSAATLMMIKPILLQEVSAKYAFGKRLTSAKTRQPTPRWPRFGADADKVFSRNLFLGAKG